LRRCIRSAGRGRGEKCREVADGRGGLIRSCEEEEEEEEGANRTRWTRDELDSKS